MQFWTAQYRYPGPHRLDITVKGDDPIGSVFAPTWKMVIAHKHSKDDAAYIKEYQSMMQDSYRNHPLEWQRVLGHEYIVLVCFCAANSFCHRLLLAEYLQKCGTEYMGELTDFSAWK